MGIFYEEKWECELCKFEFLGERGMYEADPNDFGTTHIVSPYYCPKCHSVKNVANWASIDSPQKENEEFIRNDSDICEHCGTKMQILDKEMEYICPKCGKGKLKFIDEDECWT